ncbi:uncharacterized protein KGF55_003872 [Candida pseudojiufengensis]|uniref:uncharacterized protein n=1 Tax=Candida pseudojiufengensis TaxID=497109 RepID=UPI0022258961|nr:uncharacterized protein KGF55_003872 [Candida pseudojiufengensis]KAI5961901.1 hypothetical protein KGF55_003872 [Candida pseudojiufengensis]
MVLYFENKIQYNFDFETTTLAHLNRYPNPYAKHVLSVDTLDSHIDKEGQLNITRIIVKTGRLPKFVRPFLGSTNLNSWIIEKLIINPKTKTMKSYTSNIDHRKFIRIEEFLNFQTDKSLLNLIECNAKVKFSSNLIGLKSKIEEWSHQKFSKNINNSRDGLTYVMNKMKEKGKYYFIKKNMNNGLGV